MFEAQNTNLIWGTFPFEMLPKHVDWLLLQRFNNPEQAIWINYSIIMFSSMTLEGALEYAFRSDLRHSKGYGWYAHEDAELQALEKRIGHASGWRNYKELIKDIYGKPVSSFVVDQELLETIDILFKLRDSSVAHGRSMNLVEKESFVWDSQKHHDIDIFLKKRDLITRNPGQIPECMDWFSDSCASFFWNSILTFLYRIRWASSANIISYIATQPGYSAEFIATLNDHHTNEAQTKN